MNHNVWFLECRYFGYEQLISFCFVNLYANQNFKDLRLPAAKAAIVSFSSSSIEPEENNWTNDIGQKTSISYILANLMATSMRILYFFTFVIRRVVAVIALWLVFRRSLVVTSKLA